MASFRDNYTLSSQIGIAILAGALCVLAPGCGDSSSPAAGTSGAGGASGAGGMSGSGGTSAKLWDLILTGSGYGVHTGQTMYFALFDNDDDTAPAATATLVVDSDEITQMFADVFTLFSGITYTLYYYADVNDNGICEDGEGPDHHWSVSIAEPSGDVTITKNHTLSFNGDCSKHNLQ